MVLLIALLHALPVLWAGAQGMRGLPFWLLCAAMVGVAVGLGEPDDAVYDVAAVAVAALLMRPTRDPSTPAVRRQPSRPQPRADTRAGGALHSTVAWTFAALLVYVVGSGIYDEVLHGSARRARERDSGSEAARRAGADTSRSASATAVRDRHAAAHGSALPRGDVRGCLELGTNAAVAACANGSR